METFELEESHSTPKVLLRKDGFISFSGKLLPEKGQIFYRPIFNWLNEYSKSPEKLTEVIFEIENINSVSFRCIFDILKILEKIQGFGSEVLIKWFYDPENTDILDAGRFLEGLLNLKIEFLEVKNTQ